MQKFKYEKVSVKLRKCES